jgi:hypothetical protein
MAPPDLGFTGRLAALGARRGRPGSGLPGGGRVGVRVAARTEGRQRAAVRAAAGTGRRGRQDLWQQFDQAITRLNTVAAGENMHDVAHAHEQLSAIAQQLSNAVHTEDPASTRHARTTLGLTRGAEARFHAHTTCRLQGRSLFAYLAELLAGQRARRSGRSAGLSGERSNAYRNV